jgi:hypothetical protein
VLVLDERHLRRILTRYFAHYHQARTHLALDKDAPDFRTIETSHAPERSCSFPKSAACSIATSAKPRSSASSGRLHRRPIQFRLRARRSSIATPLGPRAASALN